MRRLLAAEGILLVNTRWLSRARWLALAACLALAGCVADDKVSSPPSSVVRTTQSSPSRAAATTEPPIPVATTLVPPPGPLIGVAVPEGRIETIRAIEADVGETMHLIRLFRRWEDDLGASDVALIQAEGRAVHLSVRPVRKDGTPIPWVEISTASEGTLLHDEMVAWADDLIALGPDLRFTLNHEPETRDSAPNGTALEYRAAWRRFVELVRDRGGDDIDMVWTVGVDSLASGSGESWYPGDDVVDVIGADLYNWYTCQGTDRPWVSFDTLIEPAVRFADDRARPLALPEFASAADPANEQRRVGWMDAAVDVLIGWDEGPYRAVDLDYVAWFDVTAPGGTYPECAWSHRSDEPTRRAFSRMVRDLVGR